MVKYRKSLSVLSLFLVIMVLIGSGFSICQAKNLESQSDPNVVDNQVQVPYYFGSDSTNYLQPDNRITINFDNNGDAEVLMRLHVKAYYPTGVGDLVEVPVPYPPDRVSVARVDVSRSTNPAYTVVGTENQTTIQIAMEDSPREVYVEVLYIVRGLSDLQDYSIRFLLSSFAAEVSLNLMIENKEAWIARDSVELTPSSSKDTYFLVNEEALPFAVFLVLSNVNSKVIELSLGTQAAPYSLEYIPFFALILAATPSTFFLILARIVVAITRRRRVGVIGLAYRNLHRRIGRLVLTILGVSIPTMLLVQMLVQSTLAQKMLGTGASEGGWYIALILLISVVIGGFQVFNTVYSSVLDRMRELGVMKAIGFNPSHIGRMVMAESTIIGIMAGLLGSFLAALLAILSAQVFYGLSIPNTVFAEMVANTFGGTSSNNPFTRNSAIAMVLIMVVNPLIAQMYPSDYDTHTELSMALTYFLFLVLVRPTDPFTVDRLVDLAPSLAVNMLQGILFTVLLSVSAGSYVAYRAGKIEPSEAMRSV
jgi:hypothetical protein